MATFAVVGIAIPARGQIAEPDTSKARVRLGPLLLNPTIELTNLGIDTNVFNEPSDVAKRDFTLTLTPKSALWLKAGRTWLTGLLHEDVIWFKEYASQRAVNNAVTADWIAPLNRLSFDIGGAWDWVKDRPGYEIDERAMRRDQDFRVAIEVRALSKSFIGVRFEQRQVDYDEAATFRGASLRTQLNHTSRTGVVTLRHQLTPLTSISVDAGRSEERFDFSPLRDNDSTIAGVQVTFDPFALIKGSARFGYRKLDPVIGGLAGYSGSTAQVDLSYSLYGTTRFAVQSMRDVSYSYDINSPYYLQTGIIGSLAQQIYGPIDAIARAGIQHLAYRTRDSVTLPTANSVDRFYLYGGGIGYHAGRDLRIGVNIEKQQRESALSGHGFEGVKLGTTVTYGF